MSKDISRIEKPKLKGINFFLFLMPKEYHEEHVGDLMEMIFDLKKKRI